MSGPKPRGSVTITSSGRARARIKIHGKEHVETFDTDAEAWAFLAALLDESKPDTRKTLASFGKRWLDTRELSGVYRHVDKERSVWSAHVLTWECAEWEVAKIARKHVASFVRDLSAKNSAKGTPLSRAVVKHALRLVKRCLDAAADEGLVSANPAAGVEVPRRAGGPRKWTYLTVDEIERVLALSHDERDPRPMDLTLERRAVYAIAIYAGLRKSEIWALRWEHMDLEGARPQIHVREGKSDAAVRDVPLLPQALEHVRRWRDRELGVTRGFGLVFPPGPRSDKARRGDDADAGWRDHPYTYRGVRKVRQGSATRAQLGRHVRFHDLRHTCASHLVMGSWTPEPLTIQQTRRWLGHSSTSVTDRYAHMGTDGLHAAIEGEESGQRTNRGATRLTTRKDA
jgi:integrase